MDRVHVFEPIKAIVNNIAKIDYMKFIIHGELKYVEEDLPFEWDWLDISISKHITLLYYIVSIYDLLTASHVFIKNVTY